MSKKLDYTKAELLEKIGQLRYSVEAGAFEDSTEHLFDIIRAVFRIEVGRRMKASQRFSNKRDEWGEYLG